MMPTFFHFMENILYVHTQRNQAIQFDQAVKHAVVGSRLIPSQSRSYSNAVTKINVGQRDDDQWDIRRRRNLSYTGFFYKKISELLGLWKRGFPGDSYTEFQVIYTPQ